jgi:alcohol dehydrogenase class IV
VRPLVVTDVGVRAAGVLGRALDALGDLPHVVFDGAPSDPTEAAVRAACRVLERGRCGGLVAVGGASSIDLAKGVAIAAPHASCAARASMKRRNTLLLPFKDKAAGLVYPCAFARSSKNCSSSVEPLSAAVDASFSIVVVTASK